MGLLDRAMDRLKAEGRSGKLPPAPHADAPDDPVTSGPYSAGAPGTAPVEMDASSVDGDPVANGAGEFDTGLLAERGYLVPGSNLDPSLHDEFRRIKREILLRIASTDLDGRGRAGESRNFVMITSAVSGEGKTFVASNLAFSIAQEVDRTVLLIDGDVLRRGASRLLGVESRPGLMDYLAEDKTDLAELLLRPRGVPNMRFLPAGAPHAGVNELLASERMGRLVRELSERYPERVVIVDAPPLLLASETSVLMQHVPNVAMVVRADVTHQNEVSHALEAIPEDQFAGLILNAATRNIAADGYGSYQYK